MPFLRPASLFAGAALALAAAASQGAPSSYPLGLDVRALTLSPGGSGSYVVIVRNSGGHRTGAMTLSLVDLSTAIVGAAAQPQVSRATGTVRADVALRTVAITGGHAYLARLPGLAAGASTRVTVEAAAARLGGSPLTCLAAGVVLGDKVPPANVSSLFPAAQESFCEGPGQVRTPTPLPFSVALQGPTDTHAGAKATYTVTVTSHAATTIRDGAIGLTQLDPVTGRPLHLATDWPVTRTTNAAGEEALLTHLGPGKTIAFHVTMRAPGGSPGTARGKHLYFTRFGVGASRTSRPRELLSAALLSTLHTP